MCICRVRRYPVFRPLRRLQTPRAPSHEAGVNDLGGTLINESISTAAGAKHGQRLSPKELRTLARGGGCVPAQRSTTYAILREFGSAAEAGEEAVDEEGVA